MTTSTLQADLVMEGGGVKGAAFIGALDVLSAAGCTFPRIAGTSAGAITGALLAALQRAGESPQRLRELVASLDYAQVPDSSRAGRALGPAHVLADVVSLVISGGLNEGRYLHTWLTGVLADLGVQTFGDLRRTDPGSALAPEREFSLVVVTSDLSNQRMSILPWDYEHYGLEVDEQSVATAVCASAAIPFMFRPARLRLPQRGSVSLADGGLLSNYPIGVFDQPDRAAARWPTVGLRLSAREDDPAVAEPVSGLLGVTKAVVSTALQGIDRRHIDEPDTIARTMFIDASGVSALDFALSPTQSERLIQSGREAAEKFLSTKAPDHWPGR